MHKDMLTRHTACDCDSDFAFAGTIHVQVVRLSPCGDGFAEEGFARVGDARLARIEREQRGLVIRHRNV